MTINNVHTSSKNPLYGDEMKTDCFCQHPVLTHYESQLLACENQVDTFRPCEPAPPRNSHLPSQDLPPPNAPSESESSRLPLPVFTTATNSTACSATPKAQASNPTRRCKSIFNIDHKEMQTLYRESIRMKIVDYCMTKYESFAAGLLGWGYAVEDAKLYVIVIAQNASLVGRRVSFSTAVIQRNKFLLISVS